MPPVAVCELLVGGMTCAACTGAVQGSLIKCPGVFQVQVDLLRETARVAYNSEMITPAELCQAVENLGFQSQVLQIFVASNANPSDESSEETTARTAEPTTPNDERRETLKRQLSKGPQADACQEEKAELRLPQCQEPAKQAQDFSELWAMSKATLRLAIADRQGLSAESACSTLRTIKGVLGCAVTSFRGVEAHCAKQLMLTYKPQVVGARELHLMLVAQGFSPFILSEDPLEKQKEAVLGNRRDILRSLLLSLLPALAVVCLSVMARSHHLPPPLVRECFPGMRLSTLLLLLLATPVQFYGGRSFHRAALKGLRHRQFSMEFLVSLGSNLAFFYSALSCMQSAATSVWCRPLLSAVDVAAAAAASAGAHGPASHKTSQFYELFERAEPQVFLDTCVMLICVVLLGKLLQLRAKERILEQLHSLHRLQARTVHLVLRSPDAAVARCLQQSSPQSSCAKREEEGGRSTSCNNNSNKNKNTNKNNSNNNRNNNHCSGPSGLLELATLFAADSSDDVLSPPPPPLRWWQKVAAACGMQAGRYLNAYNPLTQPASCSLGDEGDETADGRKPSSCCSKRADLLQRKKIAEASKAEDAARKTADEVIISAELLQAGDVVRVPPQEVLPADGILLAPQVLHVDERLVSGEGRGICKLAGQRVIGGSRNASHADAFIQVQVVGDASVLQTLLRLVQTGQQQQQPLQKAAEKFAAYFIPIVLCITATAAIVWAVRVFATADTLPLSPLQQIRQRLLELELREGLSGSQVQQQLQQQLQQQQHFESHGNFLTAAGPLRSAPTSSPVEAPPVSSHAAAAAAAACRLSNWVLTWDSLLFALRFGVAVCCAACPCAIGLAAPAAVAAATAAAAARGVFFKTGKALEAAANVNCLVVDKTGTLTTGDLRAAACVLHIKHLEQLLLPAMERSTNALKAFVPHCKTNSDTCGSASSASGATNDIKRAVCCRSSSSTSTPRSSNTRTSESLPSPSDSISGSVASESIISLEVAAPPSADTVAAGEDRFSPPPCCRRQPQGSSGSLERNCGAPLAFCRLDALWEAPEENSSSSCCSSTSSSSTIPCSSSTSCSSNGSAHANLERESSPKCSTWHNNSSNSSSSAGVYEAEDLRGESVASAATGCFLWALSSLEQGSSHSVGEALVQAYDRWRRLHQQRAVVNASESREGLGVWAATAAVRCLPPPQSCEQPQLLSRGIEGYIQTRDNLRLRLRVSATSPEDEKRNNNDDTSPQKEKLGAEETLQLQEWTTWHELHCGPVVHLHAYVAADGESCGVSLGTGWVWLGSVALQDEIKEETKLAVQYLRKCLGFSIFMCTGDNPRTASRVGAALNIPEECVVSQQTPEDKVRFLRSLAKTDTPQIATSPTVTSGNSSSTTALLRREREEPPVCCMVGDGLNDSPALAEAALGVAFGVGNALPLAAAAVAVGGRSWTELVDLFRIARQTRNIIWWNLLWACVFNLVSVPLAAGVAYPTVSLHPAAAAAAMACSCLLVLLNAQRLTRFKETTAEDMARELAKAATTETETEKEREEHAEKSPQSATSLQLQDEEETCPPFAHAFGEDLLSLSSADTLAAASCCQQETAQSHCIRPLDLPLRKPDGTFFEFSDFEN